MGAQEPEEEEEEEDELPEGESVFKRLDI